MHDNYIIKGKSNNGWRPVLMRDGSGYTYLHEDGHLMEHRFAYATEFHDEMAAVEVKDGDHERRSTYVSADEHVLDVRFSDVTRFIGDYAKAYIDDQEYYVDKSGTYFQFKNTLFDKLQPVKQGDTRGIFIKNKRTGQTLTTNFIPLRKGKEGMLPILMKDGSGQTFMDSQYNIMSDRFLEVGDFTMGYAPALTYAGSIVYISKNGTIFPEAYFAKKVHELFEIMDDQIKNFEHYEEFFGDEEDEDFEGEGFEDEEDFYDEY